MSRKDGRRFDRLDVLGPGEEHRPSQDDQDRSRAIYSEDVTEQPYTKEGLDNGACGT